MSDSIAAFALSLFKKKPKVMFKERTFALNRKNPPLEALHGEP
jgi:hypothetical protein